LTGEAAASDGRPKGSVEAAPRGHEEHGVVRAVELLSKDDLPSIAVTIVR
jgi:hypothetical protein